MFTGLLITILVLAGAITAVGGGIVFAQRRRQQLAGGPSTKLLTDGSGTKLLERTIRDLRAGDIITQDSRDFLVEGVVNYDEDGHRWSAGYLVDGDDKRWIVVGMERGGPLIVRAMKLDDSVEMSGYPPETLLVGGGRFTLDKKGNATCRISGETGGLGGSSAQGTEAVARCRWWQYESPGDDTVIVEQWGDTFRVLRGQKMDASQLELMPGS